MIRAWRVHELGEPAAVLRLDEVEAPRPRAGEALLEVELVGVNFPDLLQVRGRYQIRPPLPFVAGQEVIGRVVAVERADERAGDGADDGIEPGARVAWLGRGALAEQVVAPLAELLPIPDAMPSPVAAALLMNYGTALFALRDRGHLRAGEILLVHGGTGGIGSAAIDLGTALGALVIATASGPDKVALLERLGADVAIDVGAGVTADEVVELVRAVTDGQGADVVLDPVGGDLFDLSTRVVAWGGRLLVVGFAGGRIPTVAANHVLLHNYAVVGVYWGGELGRDPAARRDAHDELCRRWLAGELHPHIGAELPFEDAPAALERLASRTATGKMVVRIGADTASGGGGHGPP